MGWRIAPPPICRVIVSRYAIYTAASRYAALYAARRGKRYASYATAATGDDATLLRYH